MHRRVLPSLVVVVLTLTCASTEAKQLPQLQRGPVYLWSDQSYIASDSVGLTSRAWYETASVRGVTKQLLSSLLGGSKVRVAAQPLLNATHLLQQPPKTVVVLVGSQIPRSGDDAVQQGLQGFLDAASSSLALPNVLHKAASHASSEMLSLLQAEEGADSVQVLGDCEGAGSAGKASTEAFKALQQSTQMSKVILMCSSEETGQAELQLLAQVQKALKDSAQPHVMVYAVQPHAGEASPTRRSLLAVGRKSRRDFVCDAPCQAQVKLIEGVILAVNLIAAIWIGSWMMNALGTPTRFETPKEGMQRE
ncbi:hypothetical protein CVIRNUC_002803 [Coccomyxa viridis]|uniref:Uncharacterized protein n=1 Tax=Coccomyxa viridis TaxID=1274662 RepID=A0AAV1I150_9CHLO|nr:hypothetical protein CVIRNUC_002803 [Coccomyxa viridis]